MTYVSVSVLIKYLSTMSEKPKPKKPIKSRTFTNGANPKNESRKQRTTSKQSNPGKTKVVENSSTTESSQQFVRDDVLVISENPSSKYSKRKISNNWTKYEVPIDNYEQYEDKGAFGANYEELLQMPISSGYFQFKHEKSWSGNNKSNIIDDLFKLDPKSLSDGMSCIPFYIQNRLDPSLFDKDHIDRMNKAADLNRKQYEQNLPMMSQEKELAMKMVNLLSEKKLQTEDSVVKICTQKEASSTQVVKTANPTGSAIEDIMLNLDIEQWLEEHLEE